MTKDLFNSFCILIHSGLEIKILIIYFYPVFYITEDTKTKKEKKGFLIFIYVIFIFYLN